MQNDLLDHDAVHAHRLEASRVVEHVRPAQGHGQHEAGEVLRQSETRHLTGWTEDRRVSAGKWQCLLSQRCMWPR